MESWESFQSRKRETDLDIWHDTYKEWNFKLIIPRWLRNRTFLWKNFEEAEINLHLSRNYAIIKDSDNILDLSSRESLANKNELIDNKFYEILESNSYIINPRQSMLIEVLIPIESGLVNFNNEIRQICRYSNMYPLADINYFDLPYGQCYIIRLKERINLPKNIMAITKPRSSLIRNGVYIQSAIWDAGYHGRGHIMLIVENPYGIKLTYDARICQMIFIKLNKESLGYSGIFQEE